MAKIVGKTALDMTRWENQYNDSSGVDVGEHDSHHFIASTAIHTFSVTGENFDYTDVDDDTIPTDGTVQTFRAATNGQLNFSITGMADDAGTITQYVANEDWDAFASDVFSGEDTIIGSKHADHLRGFAGADTIKGRSGIDFISGDAGADTLAGGAGADRFDYNEANDSTSQFFDSITDFDTAKDHISVTHDVTDIEPTINGGHLTTAHFDTDLANQIGAGELALNTAVLFNVDGGHYDGHTFLVVNWNGHAGYQAGADLVIDVTGMSGALHVDNFVVL